MTLNLLIVGQTVFELWIKTVKMLIGSITQEPLGLPKLWCYFWVPRTIYKVLCFELIWINWQLRCRFVISESKNQVLSFSSEWYMGACKSWGHRLLLLLLLLIAKVMLGPKWRKTALWDDFRLETVTFFWKGIHREGGTHILKGYGDVLRSWPPFFRPFAAP